MSARLPAIIFDTATYPEQEQGEAWRAHIAPYFAIEPDQGDHPGTPRSAQHVVNLGETLVGLTKAEEQVFARTRQQIARERLDHFLIQVFLAGGGAMPDQTVAAGDILIIDLGQPHLMLNHDFSHVTFVLPRGMNPQLDHILERLHGRTLPHANLQVQLLGQHMQAVWAAVPDLTMADGPAVSRGLCGLASHLLAGSSDQLADGVPDVANAMKQAISRYLDENLSRAVSTAEIVQRFHVSRATIYRMFAAEGGLHAYLRRRRLTRAYRMLTTRPATTISAIGWACGFTGDSQFARAFRQHFGRSPREVRFGGSPHNPIDPPASGHSMRHWLASLSPGADLSGEARVHPIGPG